MTTRYRSWFLPSTVWAQGIKLGDKCLHLLSHLVWNPDNFNLMGSLHNLRIICSLLRASPQAKRVSPRGSEVNGCSAPACVCRVIRSWLAGFGQHQPGEVRLVLVCCSTVFLCVTWSQQAPFCRRIWLRKQWCWHEACVCLGGQEPKEGNRPHTKG